MRKLFTLLALLACVSWVSGQYNYSSSTGTEDAYDYTTVGTTVLGIPSQDVLSTWQTIPFNFEFFGSTVTGYKVSDNGYITFDQNASTSYSSNTIIPVSGGPKNAIYAFWDDLSVASGSGSPDGVANWTYGTAPNRVHVIQWFSVTPGSGTGFVYAAVRLYECGDFDVVLNFGNASGMTATIGCEDATETQGAMVSNSPNITYPSGVGNLNSDDKVYTFYYNGISYDLGVTDIGLTQFVTLGNNSVTGTITNYGSSTVSSFDLHYDINGAGVQTATINASVAANGGTYNFSHPNTWNVGQGGQNYTLCVWADNINGSQTDERTCNDKMCSDLFSNNGTSGQKKVIVEEFSGTWCGWCPDGAVVLEDILQTYPNDVVGVTIHGTYPNEPMSFAGGNDIITGFNQTSWPGGMVDRFLFSGESKEPHSRSSWKSNTADRLTDYTPVEVNVCHTWDPVSRLIEFTVIADFKDYAAGDMRFIPMVVENGVTGGASYDQVNYLNSQSGHPYYQAGDPIVGFVHEHTLRAVPGGAFGNSGVIPSTVSPGERYTETFSYTLPASYDENEVYLVGQVAYYSTTVGERYSLNSGWQDLGAPCTVSNEKEFSPSDMVVYPNPMSNTGVVRFEFDQTFEASFDLMNIQGQVIKNIAQGTYLAGRNYVQFNVQDIPSGVYFVQVTTPKGTVAKKFIVNK